MDTMHIQDYTIVALPRGERPVAALVPLWRGAVEATHDFLAPADIDGIEGEVGPAIEGVERLAVALATDGAPLGFIGVEGDKIEMLFVSAQSRGLGVGKALLRYALDRWGARRVDVNEQNTQGAGFYAAMGFAVRGRDELDDAGRPFPLLHLVLEG